MVKFKVKFSDNKLDKFSHLIENLSESLITTENKYNNTKETRIIKWAKINGEFLEQDFEYLNLKSKELVFSLTLTESMHMYIYIHTKYNNFCFSSKETNQFTKCKTSSTETCNNNNAEDACNCMHSCYYTDSNLALLFHHK